MRLRSKLLFRVILTDGHFTKAIDFPAETPHLAVKMAREMERGFRVTHVHQIYEVRGDCVNCGTILFAGDACDGGRQQHETMSCGECRVTRGGRINRGS